MGKGFTVATHYQFGSAFERNVVNELRGSGEFVFVSRTPGSKTLCDVIAVTTVGGWPAGYFIQLKRTKKHDAPVNTLISKRDRVDLAEMASRAGFAARIAIRRPGGGWFHSIEWYEPNEHGAMMPAEGPI